VEVLILASEKPADINNLTLPAVKVKRQRGAEPLTLFLAPFHLSVTPLMHRSGAPKRNGMLLPQCVH